MSERFPRETLIKMILEKQTLAQAAMTRERTLRFREADAAFTALTTFGHEAGILTDEEYDSFFAQMLGMELRMNLK